ncbi:hypothetical protein HanRHA438_Chr05g0213461 [Helianthus annuus]|uniref:Uncharacterized protein n=1 Tax=Helianthus annuus TaxID=4232 RepID=A0A9K3IXP4_HELAN|nr:hypothetical protein HanXRQr2_Chr05g0203601 [Helianthus annuus]KAJ0918080.1 hypothetical protein HanRHA438_Chr05g0213461 [Helianthus annuus]KAJ0921844.1 hypothetical protein HanPSC8_Chr05g0196421 [Helianthus annuus]
MVVHSVEGHNLDRTGIRIRILRNGSGAGVVVGLIVRESDLCVGVCVCVCERERGGVFILFIN